MGNLRQWIWISTRCDLPSGLAVRLLTQFGSPEAAYAAQRKDYAGIKLTEQTLEALCDKSLEEADDILRFCAREGVQILTLQDAAYPARLRLIAEPPAVLYVKGTLPPIDEVPVITVVGTRTATDYGRMLAHRLGRDLALCGATVASGSATGIDSAALYGAIEGGGSVISVLGNGIDVVYPQESRRLYEAVLQAGALVTEFPPGSPPRGLHFPNRNRILAGLGVATVVGQAKERSGALITAEQARCQGRPVFAMLTSVDDPAGLGSAHLIRRGEARLLMDAWDVMEPFEARFPDIHLVKPSRALQEQLMVGKRPEEQAFWLRLPCRKSAGPLQKVVFPPEQKQLSPARFRAAEKTWLQEVEKAAVSLSVVMPSVALPFLSSEGGGASPTAVQEIARKCPTARGDTVATPQPTEPPPARERPQPQPESEPEPEQNPLTVSPDRMPNPSELPPRPTSECLRGPLPPEGKRPGEELAASTEPKPSETTYRGQTVQAEAEAPVLSTQEPVQPLYNEVPDKHEHPRAHAKPKPPAPDSDSPSGLRVATESVPTRVHSYEENGKRLSRRDEGNISVDLKKTPNVFTDDEAQLLRLLQNGRRMTLQTLLEVSELSMRRLMTAVTVLELRELITRDQDQAYVGHVILQE